MPSINMIAPRRAEKRRLERDMRRLVIVIIAELFFAVGLGGWVFTSIFTTRSAISDLDVKIAKLQPKVREIEHYDAASEKLKPRVELLNRARSDTMRWYGTLDRLTQSLPASTWLTRISTDPRSEAGSMSLNLTGVSPDQTKVGEAMMLMQSIPQFASVDLHFTQKTTVGQAVAIEFEIGANMTEPRKPKEVSSGGTGQS